MTIDEKRQVIEVLLCLGDCCAPGLSGITGITEPGAWELYRMASFAMDPVEDERWTPGERIEPIANEAAYRLIESSPTLRREWFGR